MIVYYSICVITTSKGIFEIFEALSAPFVRFRNHLYDRTVLIDACVAGHSRVGEKQGKRDGCMTYGKIFGNPFSCFSQSWS